MSGATDYTAQKTIDWMTGKTAMPALLDRWLALFTVVGIDAGTGFTEVSGGAYARPDATTAGFNAASGSAPSSASNSGTVTFTQASANWGTVIAFGLYDAVTNGNLIWWDYLGNFSWLPAFVTLASPGVLDVKAHGYSAADSVVFSTEYGGTAPTFSQSNFTGLLAVVSPAADTFTVTNAATAVNTSSTGSGMVRKVASQVVNSGVQVTFSAGNLVLTMA